MLGQSGTPHDDRNVRRLTGKVEEDEVGARLQLVPVLIVFHEPAEIHAVVVEPRHTMTRFPVLAMTERICAGRLVDVGQSSSWRMPTLIVRAPGSLAEPGRWRDQEAVEAAIEPQKAGTSCIAALTRRMSSEVGLAAA